MINNINTYRSSIDYSKLSTPKKDTKNITFTSGASASFMDKTAEKIANKESTKKIILSIANNKFVKSIVDWASKEKPLLDKQGKQLLDKNGAPLTRNKTGNLTQYLMVLYSAVLQTNHIINIHRNKKMPEERKETLIVNNALAFVIPTVGAFTIDNSINKAIDQFQKYAEKTKGHAFNETQTSGLKALKTIFIFAMMYKYFATVITTPMADVVTDWMRDKGYIGKSRTPKQPKTESK